ncbi:biotin/lipoyl-containing protein [Actinomadura syzygii]|uniref:Biotin/lipoyl-binding protein n=1 Tax=Actinomadura syzygii TaxID=1427538 RepID=A0A5D0UE50_9ACTN|nr:biotin/lipoyl-containing protein [Actinomadura syzygii]TYC15379.1 biotin/lipoyl-binding protein [Actinomadura syzygii]
MTDVVVPKWGATMDEATIVQWLKGVGDRVAEDEPIAEMETDKATAEIVSPVGGTVVEVLVPQDADVAVGQVIARIDPDGGGAS